MSDTFKSTDNDRTGNNAMRHEYRVLTDDEKATMQRIKDLGAELFKALDETGQSRELSIAKTKVEESVMWGVKHITA
ncbi:MAG: hypothetical protein CMM61_12910 [Rhodospirillaceae bacterium]|mgnify:CR=1 FL=1|nr:hypothetical protein [Rhodospirillaceae bacterium]|tara:strand:- start:217 stop:447 length:231 start_codon:yes stop_codon:yes gene_type:complete